jgi:hypothetical protein
MIILSVGMPRAGSGWHYNLIHDLMKTTGCTDAREIREKYHLQSILTEVNCNIGVLSLRRLSMVAIPALLQKTFVIKAHAGPTLWSRLFSILGLLRITYIFRDPRDAMLSAYDYGQRALAKGHPNAFSHLVDFETALVFMEGYLRIWKKWRDERNILMARYEDLLEDYDVEVLRLVDFLNLERNKPEIKQVIERYRPARAQSQQGLHYYKGKVGRFREAFTANEQAVLVERFGLYLHQMGYKI